MAIDTGTDGAIDTADVILSRSKRSMEQGQMEKYDTGGTTATT